MISDGDIPSRFAYHWGVVSRGAAVPAVAGKRMDEAVNSLGMYWLSINAPPSAAVKTTAPQLSVR